MERTAVGDQHDVVRSFTPAEFQLHLVFNNRGRWGIVLKHRHAEDFRFNITAGQITMAYEASLKAELMNALEGNVEGRILRPFSE